MRKTLPSSALTLFALLTASGCVIVDDQPPGRVQGTVTIEFDRAAKTADVTAIECRWVIREVTVFANAEPVGSVILDLRNETPVSSVSLSVTVPGGETLFSAAVFTRSGLLVLEGEADFPIDVGADTAPVSIDLIPVAPALEICFDDEDTDPFTITNRGGGLMLWEFTADSAVVCEGQCVLARPSSGALRRGESVNLVLIGNGSRGTYYCTETSGGGETIGIPFCRNTPDDICESAPIPDCN